jgi:PKD repeat protein
MNQTSFSALSQPRLTTTQTGSLSIKLTVTNSFNCTDSVTKTIQILPLPSVDFTIQPTAFYYIDSLITFYPTITNGRSYVWCFDGKIPITTQTPTLSFNSPGTYSCSLWIENQEGCENLKTKTISVQKHYLDVAVLNTQTIKDVDGFMVVKADIANYGSVPVNSIDLHYQINDAGNIKEIWKGVLNPNTIYTYTFNSRSADQNDKTNKITCVYIEKVNGLIDQNSLNNQFCNALNLDEITVQNPLPNPTDGDITIPVILNKDVDFSISIYNATGQIMSPLSSYRGSKGLNFIHLSTTSYSRGNYIIRVIIDEQTFIKKFIKLKED